MLTRNTQRKVRLTCESLEERLTPANNPALIPPILNSMPGARATLYLDFTGHSETNWSILNLNPDTTPFDRDGNPNVFSAAEVNEIIQVWKYVAEDFLPFNINVTTVQPPSFATRTAQRIAIGGQGSFAPTALPLTVVQGSFSITPGPTQSGFVFADNLPTTKDLADAVSHAAGHTFSLDHQSIWTGPILTTPLNPGPGDLTAPIMGDPTGNPANRSLWWYGTNSLSNTTFQNDMLVIGGAINGFGFRPDDYGSTAITAYKTGNTNNPGNGFTVSGQINTPSDADAFRLTAGLGIVTVNVTVPAPFNNLDSVVSLYDVNGILLAQSNPTTSYNASLTYYTKYAGDYFAVVTSSGASALSTPTNVGANVGSYTITGSVTNIAAYAPLRWIYDPRANISYGYVTVVSSANLTGAYSINFVAPPGVTIVSPAATVINGVTRISFANVNISANSPIQFLIQVKNPLNQNLGTYYNSFLTNFFLS